MIVDLAKNAVFLVVLCFLHSLVLRHGFRRPRLTALFSGLVFGAVTVLGMAMPVHLAPGLIFDARSVVLANAGLFGGPVVAGVAAAVAGIYRLGLGPPGDMIGLAVILASAGLGLLYRHLLGRGWVGLQVWALLVFGIVVQGTAATLFLLLPGGIAWEVTRTVTPVFVPVLAAATALLAWLLRDIAARVAMEEGMARNETRLQALFETAEIAIWTVDLNPLCAALHRLRRSGVTDIAAHLADHPATARHLAETLRLLDANPAALRLSRVESPEAVRQAFLDHFDRGPRQTIEAIAGALWRGATVFRGQAVFPDAEGVRFDAILTVPLPPDPETRSHVPVTLLDVTERVRAERVMREREELYRSVIVTAHDGFWMTDRVGRLLEVNDAYLRMTGYSREDLLGCTPSDVDVLHDEDRVERRISALIEAGGDLFETRHRAKDGRLLDVEIGISYADIAGGRLFVFIRDITDKKRTEAAILGAKTAAEQANRAKSEFLAAMSHDLRTPLNAIMGFADMMRLNMFGPLGDPRYQEYADNIYNSGALLVSLVNDVLDLSKVEAGKYELREEVLDLRSVMAAARRHTAAMADAAGQTVVLSVPEPLPCLRGDERALLQIFNNLLSNAVKFNRPGGTIRFEATRHEDGAILVRVIDAGPGMDSAGIARALAPFEQADSRHPRAHEGSGLGLYLCTKLMAVFGGSLHIDSAPGRGTTVILRFPSERTLEPAAPDADHAVVRSGA
ncbi:PAS domain S-box protein [Roseospira goensis]|uniref:histidine kinase n=1 Tax=Roseospira goensis TaxID=391922 RepID=A0A7W6RWD6_9PROT|nr:PAS domain S-box protein [Roseospira goensis]MBB4284478.1 PAS domain S-box-containing protein [Roseospira goensis]